MRQWWPEKGLGSWKVVALIGNTSFLLIHRVAHRKIQQKYAKKYGKYRTNTEKYERNTKRGPESF